MCSQRCTDSILDEVEILAEDTLSIRTGNVAVGIRRKGLDHKKGNEEEISKFSAHLASINL